LPSAVDVVVCGAAGRMGRMLLALAAETPGIRVAGAIEAPGHPAVGQDAGTTAGVHPLGVAIGSDLGAVCRREHVVIDFTVPAATLAHARAAAAAGAALVIGTTGLDAGEDRELRRIAAATRAVIAATYYSDLPATSIDEGAAFVLEFALAFVVQLLARFELIPRQRVVALRRKAYGR
jgi:4-hydroxy-tetrahydrodipicolinate reductase